MRTSGFTEQQRLAKVCREEKQGRERIKFRKKYELTISNRIFKLHLEDH